MDDLSTALEKKYIGLRSGTQILVNHLMYADDLVLLSPCHKGLTELISTCERYAESHNIVFNPNKSASIIFPYKNARKDVFNNFYLNGVPINFVERIKYLGYHIDHELNDDTAMLNQVRQIYARGNQLRRDFQMCSLDCKRLLFTTYLSSFYLSSVWTCYKQSSLRKVFVAYGDCIKFLMGVPRYESTSLICTYLNIASCQSILRKGVWSLESRIKNSTNVILESLYSSSVRLLSNIWDSWQRMLYTIYM